VTAPEQLQGFPPILVLDTRHPIQQFWMRIGGRQRLAYDDFYEIVTQIVATLLNSGVREDRQLQTLPDFNRLIGCHGIETAVLQQAVQELAYTVRQRLLDIGVYTEEGCPYFLERMLGPDIVLRLLPY
jgi:hypothetical protein